jgi:glutathione S-transferase
MITVYGFSPSGNCHKLRLLLTQLGRPFDWIEIDSSKGETRTAAYLAKNPNGRVPMIETEDGRIMVESNAIMYWLADGTTYFQGDTWQRAQTRAWTYFEQYSHEPYVAVARFICGWTPLDSPRRQELPKLHERGYQAFDVMEKYLIANTWFSGHECGVADIALFAYTHCAGDGGFDLSRYPSILRWLDAVKATPNFVPMPRMADDALALIAQSR